MLLRLFLSTLTLGCVFAQEPSVLFRSCIKPGYRNPRKLIDYSGAIHIRSYVTGLTCSMEISGFNFSQLKVFQQFEPSNCTDRVHHIQIESRQYCPANYNVTHFKEYQPAPNFTTVSRNGELSQNTAYYYHGKVTINSKFTTNCDQL